jgi:hypothetical protein
MQAALLIHLKNPLAEFQQETMISIEHESLDYTTSIFPQTMVSVSS